MTQGATASKQAAPFKATPMEAIVRLALRRPYTLVVMAILIAIYGTLAAIRTPADIFLNIGIPIISVIWSFTGLPPDDMSGHIVYFFERSLTTTVNDIEHIEFAIGRGLRHRQNFFPADSRHQCRAGAGHRRIADCLKIAPARYYPGARIELQCVERSHHPGSAFPAINYRRPDLTISG